MQAGKSPNYTGEMEDRLIQFVDHECDGYFDYEQAKVIAAELGKKPRSIITKARLLQLDYQPMGLGIASELTTIADFSLASAQPTTRREHAQSNQPAGQNAMMGSAHFDGDLSRNGQEITTRADDNFRSKDEANLSPDTNTPPTESSLAPSAVNQASSLARLKSARQREFGTDEQWQASVDELEQEWLTLGLKRLWWQNYSDFRRELRLSQQSIPNDLLFNETEILDKRACLITEAEQQFFEAMLKNLDIGFWRTLFGRRIKDLDQLRNRYCKTAQAEEFEDAWEDYSAHLQRLVEVSADEMFGQTERDERLQPLVGAMRAEFLEQQQERVARHQSFKSFVTTLPEDELDTDLSTLERQFVAIGRSREWFKEFEELVDEANGCQSQGENESPVRVLQSDFLVTMKDKLQNYKRYNELREYCFANNISDLIRRISFFESTLASAHADGSTTAEIDEMLNTFTRGLTSMVERHQFKAVRAGKKRKRRMVARKRVSHASRISEWTEYKHRYLGEQYNVIPAFNRLRQIVRLCPEWTSLLNEFREEILTSRKKPFHRRDQEISDTREFVDQISTVIDAEISVDVAYRLLEKELVAEKHFQDELEQVRSKLKANLESDNPDFCQYSLETKQTFVNLISNLREKGKVTSLASWHRRDDSADLPNQKSAS
jgi:hypothetical protein